MDLGGFFILDVAGTSLHAGRKMTRAVPTCGHGVLTPRTRSILEAAEGGHGLRVLKHRCAVFPAFYGQPLPATKDYAALVLLTVRHRFGVRNGAHHAHHLGGVISVAGSGWP